MAFDQLQKILDAGGFRIINLGSPTTAGDAAIVTATLSDIQPTSGGISALGASFKAAPADHAHADLLTKVVRMKTTGNLSVTASGTGAGKTLTATANGAFTADGVSGALNDRVLVPHQTTGADCGIYQLTTVGTGGTPFVRTRVVDFDAAAEVVSGVRVFVSEGTSYGGSYWTLTTANPVTVDTTALVFKKTGGAVSVVQLTDASTIAVNAALFSVEGTDIAEVTITAGRTIGNWTNPTSGQRILFRVKQNGTGGFALSGDTKTRFGTDITGYPTAPAANKMTRVLQEYHLTDDKYDVVSTVNGF